MMVPEDGRIKFRNHMKKLRQGGTISMEEIYGPSADSPSEARPQTNNGWTNDAPTRQPPKYVEPTDSGYPGLEPPVG